MMLPKAGTHAEEDSSRDSYNGQLLRDIEEISKALSLHSIPTKALVSLSQVRSKSVGKTRLMDAETIPNQRTSNNYAFQRGKKSLSAWSWKKPLKALAHIRQHRFDICFVLCAHSIEGLPSSFNGSTLVVQWKKDVTVLSTLPSRVSGGIAKFEETLMHRGTVYGDRSGPHKSAKYETELFLIYASAVEAPGLDLGNHWIDLTRLLPLSLDDLENGRSATEWTTSFKLSGVANDAILNVSFGYSIVRDDLVNLHENHIATSGSTNSRGVLKQARNVSGQLNHLSVPAGEVDSSHQISPNLDFELSRSIDLLYQKLNIGNLQSIEARDMLLEHIIENPQPGPGVESAKQMDDCDGAEFCFTEKGIEISNSEGNSVQNIDPSTIEIIDVTEIFKDKDSSLDDKSKLCLHERLFMHPRETKSGESESLPGESESAYSSQVISELFDFESSSGADEFLEQESFQEVKSSYKVMEMAKKSLSLDDFTESVASEFLNMLELEDLPYAFSSDTAAPDSPREQLLKEFEKEALASGDFFLDCEYESVPSHQEERSADFSLKMPATNFLLDYETESSDHEERSEEFSFITTNKTLEDNNSNNMERKDQILIKRRNARVLEDLETEALMREWGLDDRRFGKSPRVPSDGFGSPIELPLEEQLQLPPLGEGFGHLVRTKSRGYIRSMSPLPPRNSKNGASLIMQVSAPVVLPAELGFDVIEILQSLASLGTETFCKQVKALMPLEHLTGKTLHQVAEDYSAMFERLDLNSPTEDKTVLEYGSLHQPSSFHRCNEFNHSESFMFSDYVSLEALAPFAMDRIELLSLEGLKIQSDMSDQEAPSSIHTNPSIYPESISQLIDSSLSFDEFVRLDAGIISNEEDRIHEQNIRGKNSFLADKLTVAFMVVLRDPLRNYEPVGVPMLALIQVERDDFSTTPDNCSMNSEELKSEKPSWKIIQVHLTGVKTESTVDCSWGSKAEQQSGNRWLLANGISKCKKLPFSTSMEIILRPNTLRTRKSENFLWSLSSDNNGEEFNERKTGDLASVTRNPNIIFPNRDLV